MDALRIVAVVLIVLFGVVMLVPWLRDRFEIFTSRIASRGRAGRGGTVRGAQPPDAQPNRGVPRRGFWSGVVVGLSLGLIWTPCVGPIMASVISLALTQHVDGGSVFITLAYTVGTAIPMLGVMLGGRALLNKVPALTRNSGNIQKGFGVLMIVMGVAIGFGWDREFQASVLRAFPDYGTGLTAIEKVTPVQAVLKTREPSGNGVTASGRGRVLGAGDRALRTVCSATMAPPRLRHEGKLVQHGGASPASGQIAEGGSMPLTLESLRGKVVVVDFWTYSCVNCVRTLPYLKAWYDTYRDKGLVIVGVHTPEFEFEKNTANVARAIKDLGVTGPWCRTTTTRSGTRTPTSTGRPTTSSMPRAGCATSTSAKGTTTSRRR